MNDLALWASSHRDTIIASAITIVTLSSPWWFSLLVSRIKTKNRQKILDKKDFIDSLEKELIALEKALSELNESEKRINELGTIFFDEIESKINRKAGRYPKFFLKDKFWKMPELAQAIEHAFSWVKPYLQKLEGKNKKLFNELDKEVWNLSSMVKTSIEWLDLYYLAPKEMSPADWQESVIHDLLSGLGNFIPKFKKLISWRRIEIIEKLRNLQRKPASKLDKL